MKIIGVNVGGTRISAGLVHEGKVLKESTVPTPWDRPGYEVVQALFQVIEEVFDSGVTGIGIGVPGLVDLHDNLVLDAGTIPGLDAVPLKELISENFNKEVLVNNSANCFALGEKYFGKGKAYSSFVGITIGAGLGTGIIINDRLYSGQLCGAGEFGKIYYRDKNLEAFSSSQFFQNKGMDPKLVFRRASIGDPVAIKLFNDLGKHLGSAVAAILYTLAPQAVVFGGSLSKGYKFFSDAMFEFLDDNFPYRRLLNQLAIELSDNEKAEILGASSLILENQSGH